MKVARYNYRFYPNALQKAQLAKEFGCARYVYNWGLQESFDIFKERALQEQQGVPEEERVKLTYGVLCKRLTRLKRQDKTSFLQEVSNVTLQQSLRHLMAAWTASSEGRAKRPTFKKKRLCKASATYMSNSFRVKQGEVYLAKMKDPLKIKWSRDLPSLPSSCTVSRDKAERYFISFVVELTPLGTCALPKTVGVDLGLTHFATLSDGEKVENPRFLKRKMSKLKAAQKALSRKQKGSANRAKARRRVAKLHAQVADARRDFQHKLSTRLVRENQGIGLESLAVVKMVQTRHLAQNIQDAAWGSFVEKLRYKADWQGRDAVLVDRFTPSSKTCSCCGWVKSAMPLSVRRWRCARCQSEHDRDVHAAKNILNAAGLAEFSNACREEATGVPVQLRLF